MKTKTRTVVKAVDIRSAEDIAAIEVYEAKITSMYWSLMFDPFHQMWRKNGIQPMSREEVLRECRA